MSSVKILQLVDKKIRFGSKGLKNKILREQIGSEAGRSNTADSA